MGIYELLEEIPMIRELLAVKKYGLKVYELETVQKQIAYQALKQNRKNIEGKTSKTEDEERYISRNFIIKEKYQTYTALKNKNLIISTKLTFEIIKNGNFSGIYHFSTPFEDLVFPEFKEFIKVNKNRFENFSFDAKLIEFKRDGKILTDRERPKFRYECLKDERNKKEVEFTLNNCKEGDEITFAHSVTIENEYSEEHIRLKRNEPEKYGTNIKMSVPIASIKMNFQEETYGDTPSFNLIPKMMKQQSPIEATTTIDGLYYKKNIWNIYFHNYHDGLYFSID